MSDIFRFDNFKLWVSVTISLVFLTLVSVYFAFSKSEVESGIYRILVRTAASGGHGTGFKVAEPGIIVTNYHVVRGARDIRVAFLDGNVGSALEARILWFSSDKDLAILKTEEPIPGARLELADIGKAELEKTDEVTAVGFPGIVDRVAAEIEQGFLDRESISRILLDATFSSGTIQRLVPSIQRLIIQHSATVNSGNSGGPLFDVCQRVIGVNTLSATTTLDLREIARAFANRSNLQIENPGDLEFAVHIREVLRALEEENISYASTPGNCWGTTDFYERSTIGLSLLATLGSVAVCIYGIGNMRNTNSLMADAGGYEVIEGLTYVDSVGGVVDGAAVTLTARDGGEVYTLFDGGTPIDHHDVVIGRARAEADLVIRHQSVSRRHARIFAQGRGYALQDLGSTNGTFLNGRKLTANSDHALSDGVIVGFGKVEMVFSAGSGAELFGSINHDKWLLSGFDQAGNTLQFSLYQNSISGMRLGMNVIGTIGRSNSCDFTIRDDSVSREHALLGITSDGRLAIVDLGSANGTYVDNQQVGQEPIAIKPSQKIKLGSTELHLSK